MDTKWCLISSRVVRNNSYNMKWKLYNLKWGLVILKQFPGAHNIIKTVQKWKLQQWIEVSKEFSVHKWLQLRDCMVLDRTSTASDVVVKTSVDKPSNIPNRPLMPLVSSKNRKQILFHYHSKLFLYRVLLIGFFLSFFRFWYNFCASKKNEYSNSKSYCEIYL